MPADDRKAVVGDALRRRIHLELTAPGAVDQADSYLLGRFGLNARRCAGCRKQIARFSIELEIQPVPHVCQNYDSAAPSPHAPLQSTIATTAGVQHQQAESRASTSGDQEDKCMKKHVEKPRLLLTPGDRQDDTNIHLNMPSLAAC